MSGPADARPKPPVDALDPHCWACGAQDGDHDQFIGERLTVALCEPHDARFDLERGVQWFCVQCLVGRLPEPIESGHGWFVGMRTRSAVLVALQR